MLTSSPLQANAVYHYLGAIFVLKSWGGGGGGVGLSEGLSMGRKETAETFELLAASLYTCHYIPRATQKH